MIVADKINLNDQWSVKEESAHESGPNASGSKVVLEHPEGGLIYVMRAKDDIWNSHADVVQIRQFIPSEGASAMLYQNTLTDGEDIYDEVESMMVRYEDHYIELIKL